MATHFCTASPCPCRSTTAPAWANPVWVINRPCGHSYAQNCGCNYSGQLTTTVNITVEYLGRHRAR